MAIVGLCAPPFSYMKTIKVKLDEKTIEISKLPLGRYAELLKSIREIPKHVSGLSGLTNDEIFGSLPLIISECLPDVISIITIATSLKAEEIEAMGLDEVTRVVMGIIEVNNYKEVAELIKKALARPELQAAKNPGPVTPTTGIGGR